MALVLSSWPVADAAPSSSQPQAWNASAVTAIQLVSRGAAVHLLQARAGRLYEDPLAAPGGARLAASAPIGEASTSWDAKPLGPDAGKVALVFTASGSAVSSAMFLAPGAVAATRLEPEHFAVYDHTHFVRGQRDDQWAVTAVKYEDAQSIPTLFPRGAFPDLGPWPKQLGKFSDPVRDARVVQVANGFWLLMLQGLPTRAGDRKPRKGVVARMPCTITAIHLDAQWKQTGPAVPLLGDRPVYEFDAGATADGGLVVFASTPDGLLLAAGPPALDGPMPESRLRERKSNVPLSSPTVLVHQGVVHVAVLAFEGTPKAAILHGTARDELDLHP